MKLTQITGSQFKGQNRINHKLGPVNVITARNARGKTGLIQLIRTLLIGHDPILGKQMLGALLSGANPSGTATFDTGEVISRQWTRTKTGGASEVNPPTTQISIPQIMLDFQTFLDKTGPQQMAFVIAQTDLAALGYTPEAVSAKIKSVRPATPTEESEAATKLIIADLQEVDAEQKKEGFNMNVWLERVGVKLTERLRLNKAEVKRLTSAIQAQVQVKAGQEEQAGRPRATIEREIETLTAEKSAKESELAVLNEQLNTWNRTKAERDRLTAIIEAPTQETKRAELQAVLDATANSFHTALTASALVTGLGEIQSVYNRSKDRLRDAREVVRELEAELEGLEQKECCSECGYSGEEFKAFVRGKLEERLAEANKKAAEASVAEETADRAYELAQTNYDKALEADEKIEQQQRDWRKAKSDMDALVAADTSRQEAISKLSGLTLTDAPDATASDKLTIAVADIATKIRLAKQELTRAIAAAAEALTREETVRLKDKAEAELEVTNLAFKEVVKEQGDMVTNSMKALLVTANLFTDGIIVGQLDWNDELGVWRDKQWISHKVFSDMEKAVAYVGLSAALSQSSPFKLVLLDRLECIDDGNLENFIGKLFHLIRTGIIDQFVGLDVNGKRYTQTNPDLNVITL